MLNPKQQREIYDLLAATFEVGKPLLVAQAGNCLAGHGYHAKDLGYKGLNKMLEDMPVYQGTRFQTRQCFHGCGSQTRPPGIRRRCICKNVQGIGET